MSDDKTIDLASIRARLAGTEGKQYWQSLEELADSPSFKALVQREFPAQASEWLDPRGRRSSEAVAPESAPSRSCSAPAPRRGA